jgi:hypothetical protein
MEAEYINKWSDVPDGAVVVEDTYLEVYEMVTDTNGERQLKQIGWQLPAAQM